MWNPFDRLRTGARFALVFDIASSSVGVALITHHHKRSTSPRILYTSRTDMQFEESSGADNLAAALRGALQQSAESAIAALAGTEGAAKQFDIHVMAHAPWVTSDSLHAKNNFDADVQIKKGAIKHFVENSFEGLRNNRESILEAHITRVALNDYPVKEPLGRLAKSIGVSLLTSSMHPAIRNVVEETLASAFQGKHIYMHSFTYAALKLADKLGVDLDKYVLADIGGEYTEFTIVHEGTVVARSSIEFGSNYLLRAVAKKLNQPQEAAKTKFTMFVENTCTPTECKKVREALEETEGEWTESFGATCAELAKTTKLPDAVFLSSALFSLRWFTNGIEKLDFAQFTTTSKPFTVSSIIDHGAHAALYGNVYVQRDKRLLIDSLFVDKYSTEDAYEKLFVL